MARALVIVESPAKARTISRMLGPEFVVESSVGHVRDLPRGADEVPAAYKAEEWARLGVDVENGFKPLYVVSPEKRAVVANLKARLKEADELYLATDEDREGESIAWHLTEVLAPRVPVKRMVFHEITPAAIRHAVEDWRELDRRLVDAQEARRILDRLYGYEVSPVLWRKVMPRLSAGRVQSVATRMVVERERARMRFRSATWWGVEGTFAKVGAAEPAQFRASLVGLDGAPVATGRDFDEQGETRGDRVRVLAETEARALSEGLTGASFMVRSVSERPFRRSPAAPFITSTLQQEAGRKLRFSAQRAMQVAQRLYEQGWITYMRTDSTTLSDEALAAARAQATALYGAEYVPPEPRRYERRVKNAQEAHEAVRPAGEAFRTPEEAAQTLHGDELRLYELVWKRTVASQMVDATGTSAQVRMVATMPGAPAALAGAEAEFSASGRVIAFPGFLRAYVEGEDDPEAELADREVVLPRLAEGDDVRGLEIEPGPHATQPPARYTEASLVKSMEELGVGRPSTYASVISTILDRGYVWKKGGALVPSFTAFAVVGLLERYFPELVDYGFTAAMEDDLDEIASGREEALPWLTRFYFGEATGKATGKTTGKTTGKAQALAGVGDGSGGAIGAGSVEAGTARLGLKEAVAAHLGAIDAREINSIPIGVGARGDPVVVRVGRYGPYLQRGEDRASIPEDLPPDEVSVERAEELLDAPSSDRVLGTDPASGAEVQVRAGRFGPYVQFGVPTEGSAKPRTASLFKSMSPATVTLTEALELLRLPRTVGTDPESNEEILASNGRFGPYLTRGADTRSLETEEQLLTVTLTEALARFAQPKTRRGRGQSAGSLRELGPDAETGLQVLVREGRFGPYVTDGTTNASLRKGDDPLTVTIERAAELLADRRAAGPSTRRRGAAA
ncbi:MAG: type I DNA topoisomerase, partial [Acidimicrobiales bacterium]